MKLEHTHRPLTWMGAFAWVLGGTGLGFVVGFAFRTIPVYLISPWTELSDLLICAGPPLIFATAAALLVAVRRPQGYGRMAIVAALVMLCCVQVAMSMIGPAIGRQIEECSPIASGGGDEYECVSTKNSDGYFKYCTAQTVGSLPLVLMGPCEERSIGD